MIRSLEINSQLYANLRDLLSTGCVTVGDLTVDFSELQQIRLNAHKAVFNPPIKVQYKGPLGVRLTTTITQVTLRPNAIRIEVDNSPIDMELLPR